MERSACILRITAVIALALALIGLMDAVVALFFADALAPGSSAAFPWSVATVSFMSIWFIATLLMDARWNNAFLRAAHLLASVWMGFFVYFFFAAIVFAAAPEAVVFGRALLAAAAAVGCYGLIHARRHVVRRVSIAIPGLPAAWKGRTVAYVSDLHLGHILGRGTAARAAAIIAELRPDIVCIGGDMFDGTKIDERDAVAPFASIHPPLGVFFATGNHEEFSDSSRFLDAIRSVGIRVLSNESVEIDGVRIAGVNDKDSDSEAAFAAAIERVGSANGSPMILMKHQPSHLGIAAAAGVSLVFSGHTHRAQQWPLNAIARLVFGRFSYGMHGLRGMTVVTSSGFGTWGPPLRVGSDSELILATFG